MQKVFGSVTSEQTAWPHPPARHILQLLTGFAAGSGAPEELAIELLKAGPSTLLIDHSAADFLPNFVEAYNDISKVRYQKQF